MGTKPKKRKRKIRIKTGAKVVKKDSVRNDTISKTPMPRSNSAVFKVKVKKK